MTKIFLSGAKLPTDKRENVQEHSIIDGKYIVDRKGKIEVGDYFFANEAVRKCTILKEGNYPYGESENSFHSKHWNTKIVATISPVTLEGVPMIQLPDEVDKTDDEIEELAITFHGLGDTINARNFEDGFAEGYRYKAAQNKVMYSEEDMIALIEWVRNTKNTFSQLLEMQKKYQEDVVSSKNIFTEYTQFLKQHPAITELGSVSN